jgi:hypothetical protein
LSTVLGLIASDWATSRILGNWSPGASSPGQGSRCQEAGPDAMAAGAVLVALEILDTSGWNCETIGVKELVKLPVTLIRKTLNQLVNT